MDHILTCILNDDKAGSTNAAEARALIGRRQIVGLHGDICRSFRLLALAVEALLGLVHDADLAAFETDETDVRMHRPMARSRPTVRLI